MAIDNLIPLITGSLVSRGADKLLNPKGKNLNLIDTLTGGGYTGQGTSTKSKTFGGIAKQGIMSLIARSILGPILGPLALTLGTNIFNKNPNITKGLGFFNQDGSDGPPIGPGINKALTQQQIYDMDDVDPADYGLVDAGTANIQDYADIMPDDSSDSSGGPRGVDAGTANIQDYADIMPDDSSDSSDGDSGGGGGGSPGSAGPGGSDEMGSFRYGGRASYSGGGLASLLQIMAKIAQILTRPSKEYKQNVADAQVRDLDAVIQKLNTTYQQDLKDEVEAFNFFLN